MASEKNIASTTTTLWVLLLPTGRMDTYVFYHYYFLFCTCVLFFIHVIKED